MSSQFVTTSDSGRSLFATIQQITAGGTLGNIWNVTAGAWQSNPSTADRTITLTEGTGINIGTYSGGTGTLTGYTGLAVKRIHDTNLSNRCIGSTVCYLYLGVEQRDMVKVDYDSLPLAIQAYINSNGGVLSSNMRGTDNAMLAASYTAPDNANIVVAATQATTAATQATTAATQSTNAATNASTLVSRLTNTRATNLDNLDATISSRSTVTNAGIQSYLTSNPIPSSNMRGTDSALLAASYTAPDNANILVAATQATTANTNTSTLTSRLTSTRAGYLDNLSAGAVATAASITSLAGNIAVSMSSAAYYVIPSSGSTSYFVDLFLQDSTGAMEAADSTPTFTAANTSGTDRSANVSSVTTVSAGHYRVTYSVATAHASEIIVITAVATEGGNALRRTLVIPVVTEAVGGGGGGGDSFTSTDRTKLEAIHAKLPSRAYLTGTAASDGDINVDTFDGDKTTLGPSNALLATASSITALPAAVRAELNSNPVPASNMRGTDNALLAASYTAPDNAGITTAASQATTAATQATTAATQATSAASTASTINGKLTTTRANNLDYLDVAVSSRSDFDQTTDQVLVNPTGLATSAQATAIKAKTDLIGTSSVAAVANIPTASQIATQVDATLTANHPGDWAEGGDATLAKQDQILAAIAGIVPSPPSVYQVATARTWVVLGDGEDSYATNVITLPSGASVTLAMDFSGVLNPGTGVSSVTSVTDLSGNALVATSLAPSQDRRKAHFVVSGMTAGTRYELRVNVATTDSQTLTARGTLRIES